MRIVLIAILLFFVTFGVRAQEPSPDVVAQMIACGEVRGDRARLRCFEKWLPEMRTAFPESLALAEARAEAARAAAQAEAKKEFGLPPSGLVTEEREFGAEDIETAQTAGDNEFDKDGNIKSMTAGVVDVGKNVRGKIIVVLDNGQVWRQIDADQSTPYIRHKYEGTAEIKRGFMGSYVIKLSGTRESFKARRVK